MTIIQREASLDVLCSVNSHIPGFLPLPNFFLVPSTLLFSHLLLLFYFLLFSPLPSLSLISSSPSYHWVILTSMRTTVKEDSREEIRISWITPETEYHSSLCNWLFYYFIFIFISTSLPLEISQALSILILLKKWD